MSDQPPLPANPPPASDRFKAEMPQIPGVSGSSSQPSPQRRGAFMVAIGAAALLAALLVAVLLLSKARRNDSAPAPAEQATAQIDLPPDAATSVPDLPPPVATENNPVIAQVGELAKTWASRPFMFRNRLSGENVSALLVRLPGGSPAQAGGYWAFALKEAYGRCQLEFVEDIAKLRTDYGYRAASHPMVGNPCSRTVYDPLKYAAIPGNVLARGAIVQGTDLRPPLGIEVRIKGNDILASRME